MTVELAAKNSDNKSIEIKTTWENTIYYDGFTADIETGASCDFPNLEDGFEIEFKEPLEKFTEEVNFDGPGAVFFKLLLVTQYSKNKCFLKITDLLNL